MTRDDFFKAVDTDQGVTLPANREPMFSATASRERPVVDTLKAMLPDAEGPRWHRNKRYPTVWVLVLRYEFLVVRVEVRSAT